MTYRQNNIHKLKCVKSAKGMRLLQQGEWYWGNMQDFRDSFDRNTRYVAGRQLEDYVPNGRGGYAREEDMIIEQNGSLLTQNVLRHQVNVVIGCYLSQNLEMITKSRDQAEQAYAEGLSRLLKYVNDINYSKFFYANILDEYVQGAAAFVKKIYADRPDGVDVQDPLTLKLDPHCVFLDTDVQDVRGWDCNFIGYFSDMLFEELSAQFAHTRAEEQMLKEIYGDHTNDYVSIGYRDFGRNEEEPSFLTPIDPVKCRVFEIWKRENEFMHRCMDKMTGETFSCYFNEKKELVDYENQKRIIDMQRNGVMPDEIQQNLIEVIEDYQARIWHYYFIAPTGHILIEGRTPYEHGSHPFVYSLFPLVNKEIHSFIEDAIDIQRQINSLMRLNDYILRTGAKNLLLIPKSAANGMTAEEWQHVWSMPGGAAIYDDMNGQNTKIPEQINSQAQRVDIQQIIALERQFLVESTGVSDALQGGQARAGTSGTLYAQQAANAAVGLQYLFAAFGMFMAQSANKDCFNIQQFYDETRIREILGDDCDDFMAKQVKNLNFDVVITEDAASPLLRQQANDWLMSLLQMGIASLDEVVEAGDFTRGEKLLQIQKRKQEQQMQQGMPMGAAEGAVAPAAMGQGGQQPVDAQEQNPTRLSKPINPMLRNSFTPM